MWKREGGNASSWEASALYRQRALVSPPSDAAWVTDESKTFFGGENWKIGKLECAQLLFLYKIQNTKFYLPLELSIQSPSLTASVHPPQQYSRSDPICSECALPPKLSKPLPPSSHSIQRGPYVNFVQDIKENTTIAACWSHNSQYALSPFARCSGRSARL